MKNKKTIIYSIYIFSFLLLVCFSFSSIQNYVLLCAEKSLGRTLRDPGRWLEIIRHCSFIGISILGIGFFLTQIQQGILLRKKLKENICTTLSFFKNKKTALFFIGLFLFYFFAYFKIIDADFLYNDDIWRSYEGSRSWIGFSRYISEFLSIIIHNSIYLSDIAPLTYFITIFIMAFSTLLLMYILNDGKIHIAGLLSLSIVFISPFFSQNFSYRFDCIYMALAVLFPIIPFVFKNTDFKQFFFISVLCLILCCMCYQAGSSIYIIMTIFIALRKWSARQNNKNCILFCLASIISYIASLLLFKLFFMNTMSNSENDYFSTIVNISSIIPNLKKYFYATIPLFGGKWITFFFGLSIVCSIYIQTKNTRRNKALSLVVSIMTILISFCLSFGPYILFERTLFEPRAFLGFNMLAAILAFNCTTYEKKYCIFPIALMYGCFVFLFAYGNCLSEQKQYQNFRTELLLSDLNNLTNKDETAFVSFEGSIGCTAGIKETQKNYPLLKRCITIVPSEGIIWNDDFINTYNYRCKDETLGNKQDFPLLKSSYYHDIYGKDNHFYIYLK